MKRPWLFTAICCGLTGILCGTAGLFGGAHRLYSVAEIPSSVETIQLEQLRICSGKTAAVQLNPDVLAVRCSNTVLELHHRWMPFSGAEKITITIPQEQFAVLKEMLSHTLERSK